MGLMSGTSMDGIDVAIVRTDGKKMVEPVAFHFTPYAKEVKQAIRECLNPNLDDKIMQVRVKGLEAALTQAHFYAASNALTEIGMDYKEIDVVGFHGHTLMHAPAQKETLQVGDGEKLAALLGIDVVNDFRTADVNASGQGAPLVPVYHRALAVDLPKPCVFLNIGGIANVTWVSKDGNRLVAFDTGPGNALLDDWVSENSVQNFDTDGELAATGDVKPDLLDIYYINPYFNQKPPKSLDRSDFGLEPVKNEILEDGAATLTALTVETIVKAKSYFPEEPKLWVVSGGGRKNKTILKGLKEKLGVDVQPIDKYGWNGDAVEAEAFAYLAVRNLLQKPISFPTTTGVKEPMVGGVLHRASVKKVTAEGAE